MNTGALDPLMELSLICKRERLWFHVDGAIGALVNLLPEFENKLKGLADADSIAFDLHKWLYVNYEAGCLLIRDGNIHRKAFVQQADYLLKHDRGLAAGPDSFSNYGLELSRGFRSLKVWIMIREFGIEKYKRLIRQNINQAFYLGKRIRQIPLLELMTPVTLNIVCFCYNPGGMDGNDLNELNRELLMDMQEKGIAAPSYTFLDGNYVLRVSITNHRTRLQDLEILLEQTLIHGNQIYEKLCK